MFSVGVRKAILLGGVVWLTSIIGFREPFAQPAYLSSQIGSLNCNDLLESARKLRSVSLAMLATVREQRSQAGKMRKALGPDVADESVAVLSDQERQLKKTLRDVETIHCPSVLAPPSADAPR